MKKILITLVVCAMALVSKAQVGYNYAQYDIGVAAGFNKSATDFANNRNAYSFSGSFTYNFTPFVNYIAEVNIGSLKGDSLQRIIPGSAYSFTNNYTSVAFRAQLQAGELIDYSQSPIMNALKNFYIGTGIGVIYTDLKVFDTDQLSVEAKGSTVFIPLKIGYELKMLNSYNEPWAKLDIGYQTNVTFSDNLDGITSGKSNDYFSQIVIGFKFGIGGHTSYRKAIHY